MGAGPSRKQESAKSPPALQPLRAQLKKSPGEGGTTHQPRTPPRACPDPAARDQFHQTLRGASHRQSASCTFEPAAGVTPTDARTGGCGLVGGWEWYPALGTPPPPRAPLSSPAFSVCAPLVPLLTSGVGGGRWSVPGGQPGQFGAGVGAAFGGFGEVRVGAGEVAQVEHGAAAAAGRPGPRWAGARAAGGEARSPSSKLPTLGSGTRVGGPRRPGSPGPASGGGSWPLQSAPGLPWPTVPPTYIAEAVLAPGFRLPGPLPFREAPALAP